MKIFAVTREKKRFLPLLLLGDEQESMIDRYLDRGTLYVLEDGGVRGVCVVTREGDGVMELKNLAVDPAFRRRGYGRRLVEFVKERCAGRCSLLLMGTGDSPATLPFYEKCGFVPSHVVKNFFLEHYDHPIFEGGRRLVDMVYLKMELEEGEAL